MVLPWRQLSRSGYSGMAIGDTDKYQVAGYQRRGMARCRMEPGGAYQGSPSSSVTYLSSGSFVVQVVYFPTRVSLPSAAS